MVNKVVWSTKNPSWGRFIRRIGKLIRETSVSTRDGLFASYSQGLLLKRKDKFMGLIITKKDKYLLIVIAVLLIGIGGYLFFRESPAEKKCSNEVVFHPRTSKVEAYYSFSFVNKTITGFDIKQFKTKKEAVDFCVDYQS